jgi:hypothetical protein
LQYHIFSVRFERGKAIAETESRLFNAKPGPYIPKRRPHAHEGSGDLLHLVGEIATGCCLWKWLALFAIEFNRLFNDLTQFLKNRLFVIAVGPPI